MSCDFLGIIILIINNFQTSDVYKIRRNAFGRRVLRIGMYV